MLMGGKYFACSEGDARPSGRKIQGKEHPLKGDLNRENSSKEKVTGEMSAQLGGKEARKKSFYRWNTNTGGKRVTDSHACCRRMGG